MLTEPARSSLPATGNEIQEPPYRIVVCMADDPQRVEAEAFVRDAFFRTHRARIRSVMPTLLVLHDPAGSMCAVAGCRVASSERLFLESYLSQPIEEELAEHISSRPRRSEIVEVGNFAARSSRTARRFMSLLPYFLLDRKLTWVTFTATASVRRILHHIGARCVELARAEGAWVRNADDDWGRYYTHDPRVMAGYLPLARRLPALRDAAYAD